MPSYYNDIHEEEQDWAPVVMKKDKASTAVSSETAASCELGFGKHLLGARRRAKMTSSALAQSLGIPLSQLEQYEKGEAIPTRAIITRINRLCNCNLFLYV